MSRHSRIYDPERPGSEPSHNENAASNGADKHEVAPPFPIDCLPKAAAEMARAICAVERVPESLAGCCVLAVLSASIGAGLEIRSGANRTSRGNLYIVPSAESGSGKSETIRHAFKPFREFELRTVTEWAAETQPGLKADMDMLQSELAELKKKAAKCGSNEERDEVLKKFTTCYTELQQLETESQPPLLSVEDITTEVLVVLLSRGSETLASISSDAGSVINNLLGRYSKDRTDEAIYLKTWSGEAHRVHRIGRESVHLKRPCVSALWLVQPDKMDTLVGTEAFVQGGLLPRMLICHTGCQPKPIGDESIGIPIPVENDWRRLVGELLSSFRLAREPWIIEPSEEATAVLKDHFNLIVSRWHSGELRDVASFALRWTEQAWRISVCLHAGIHGEQCVKLPVDASTARNAISLADWFVEEQLRMLAGRRLASMLSVKDRVLRLLQSHPGGIRASDVYRARIVSDADAAHRLLRLMETDGELTGYDEKPETGGHITRTYSRNGITPLAV